MLIFQIFCLFFITLGTNNLKASGRLTESSEENQPQGSTRRPVTMGRDREPSPPSFSSDLSFTWGGVFWGIVKDLKHATCVSICSEDPDQEKKRN